MYCVNGSQFWTTWSFHCVPKSQQLKLYMNWQSKKKKNFRSCVNVSVAPRLSTKIKYPDYIQQFACVIVYLSVNSTTYIHAWRNSQRKLILSLVGVYICPWLSQCNILSHKQLMTTQSSQHNSQRKLNQSYTGGVYGSLNTLNTTCHTAAPKRLIIWLCT